MPRKYGYIPDLMDFRDKVYAVPRPTLAALPASVDLRPQCPPVVDQGDLNGCVGNAIAAAVQFDQMKQGIAAWAVSRLFIYYNARVIEDSIASDNGCQIRDGIKSIGQQGICSEDEWPYDVTQFATAPSAQAVRDASDNTAINYQAITRSLDQLKGCLAEGRPFVFGFSVYSSFDAIGADGMMPMPSTSEDLEGGHAVVAVGYSDELQRVIVRNSWGTSFGDNGHFYMPYAYLLDENLSDDMWRIQSVREGAATGSAG